MLTEEEIKSNYFALVCQYIKANNCLGCSFEIEDNLITKWEYDINQPELKDLESFDVEYCKQDIVMRYKWAKMPHIPCAEQKEFDLMTEEFKSVGLCVFNLSTQTLMLHNGFSWIPVSEPSKKQKRTK